MLVEFLRSNHCGNSYIIYVNPNKLHSDNINGLIYK